MIGIRWNGWSASSECAADVAQVLGKLQQPDFGTDDLLFSRHSGALQCTEAERCANPTAPRSPLILSKRWIDTAGAIARRWRSTTWSLSLCALRTGSR